MSSRAYIGLGSNLYAPKQQLLSALEEIKTLPQSQFIGRSQLYRSPPMGNTEQPDFINAVAAIDTELEPEQLLNYLAMIEQLHGRQRNGQKNQPRPLDLDILLYGNVTRETAQLVIPHPRLKERNWVLYPLADISPELVFPDGESLSSLLQKMTDKDLEILEAE